MIQLEVRPIESGEPTAAYNAWCHIRQYPPPPWSAHGAMVRASNGRWAGLVSMCFFYPAGPWFLVDGFVTNPEAPPRLRLKALELTLEQVWAYSAATGMKPIVTTWWPTILRKMRLMGFAPVPGVTMTRHSRSMVGEMPEPERKPKKTKGRSKRSSK